jgi:hypothetical protein
MMVASGVFFSCADDVATVKVANTRKQAMITSELRKEKLYRCSELDIGKSGFAIVEMLYGDILFID